MKPLRLAMPLLVGTCAQPRRYMIGLGGAQPWGDRLTDKLSFRLILH